jgi:hypothetical protein
MVTRKFYGLPKLLLSACSFLLPPGASPDGLLDLGIPANPLSIAITFSGKTEALCELPSRSVHIDPGVYIVSNRISQPNLSRI